MATYVVTATRHTDYTATIEADTFEAAEKIVDDMIDDDFEHTNSVFTLIAIEGA